MFTAWGWALQRCPLVVGVTLAKTVTQKLQSDVD